MSRDCGHHEPIFPASASGNALRFRARMRPAIPVPLRLFTVACLVIAGAAGSAAAQEKKPGETAGTPTAPPTSTAKEQPPGATPQPKSLDDLLGVPTSEQTDATKSSGDDAAEREQKKRLERSLNEASLDDLVSRAVEGMKSAADRLGDGKDAGIGTQRIQEDVVKTLDRLLEEAQKQQKQKSSSSSSRRQSGKPRDSSADPNEQNGQQSSRSEPRPGAAAGKNSSSSTENSDGQRPPDQSAADGTELEEARIEWGRLPERIRELVSQGRRDRVSTVYERLTREYYRRLAEEASK